MLTFYYYVIFGKHCNLQLEGMTEYYAPFKTLQKISFFQDLSIQLIVKEVQLLKKRVEFRIYCPRIPKNCKFSRCVPIMLIHSELITCTHTQFTILLQKLMALCIGMYLVLYQYYLNITNGLNVKFSYYNNVLELHRLFPKCNKSFSKFFI